MATTTTPVKETIPFWLAVAITVMVAIPFAVFLGGFAIPIWVSFIVWAEYFVLGAKPEALRILLPSYGLGAILTGAGLLSFVLLTMYVPGLTVNGALAVSLFVWIAFLVYIMRYSATLGQGALTYFNGVSMVLAVYFTKSFPATADLLLQPAIGTLWAIIAGYLGAAFAWFNVFITFPRKVGA